MFATFGDITTSYSRGIQVRVHVESDCSLDWWNVMNIVCTSVPFLSNNTKSLDEYKHPGNFQNLVNS